MDGKVDDNMYVLPVPIAPIFNLNRIDDKIPKEVQHPMVQGIAPLALLP